MENRHSVFTWKGTRFNRVLVELLRAKGFICSSDEIAVTIAVADPALVRSALGQELPTIADLSNCVAAIFIGKYDRHLPEKLLRDYWRKRHDDLHTPLLGFCQTLAQGKRV